MKWKLTGINTISKNKFRPDPNSKQLHLSGLLDSFPSDEINPVNLTGVVHLFEMEIQLYQT